MYIDTHCHLDDLELKTLSKEAIIKEAFDNDVSIIINIATSIDDSKLVANTVKKYQNIYGAIGVHPTQVGNLTYDDYQILEQLILDDSEGKIKAIGEFGLDYHWDYTTKEQQIPHFIKHLELARKYDKTVLIHSRKAFEDTFKILSDYQDLRIVIHCFTYNREEMAKFLSIGCYISFSGIITFEKKAEELQECTKLIPLDRLLCETDSPSLTPMPHRGKINQPSYIKYVYKKIEELRNESIYKQICKNVYKIFNIK